MPIIVSCACGRQFQAKDEHAGKQAKCPSCGGILTIQGPRVQPAIQNPAPAQAAASSAYYPEAEEAASRAAEIRQQRELAAQADARFQRVLLIVAGALVLLAGGGAAVYFGMGDGGTPPSVAEKKAEPKAPPKVEPKAETKTNAEATQTPTPPVAVVAPKEPEKPPEPQAPPFNKKAFMSYRGQTVEWSGKVVQGLSEDGSITVYLDSEVMTETTTVTYRARLKTKDSLAAPIPTGALITFSGTVQHLTQSTDGREEGGLQKVEAIYTLNVSDATILKVTALKPALTAGGQTAPIIEQTAAAAANVDDVERYLLYVIESKDGHNKTNAKIFRPDDKRLDFAHTDRAVPPDALHLMHAKFGVLASALDLELGPKPSAATDLIEARMLLDPELIGSGLWLDGKAETATFLVFLDPSRITMPDVIKKYGKPGKSMKSGDCDMHFYGRMVLMETAGGKVHAVVRKVTKGLE